MDEEANITTKFIDKNDANGIHFDTDYTVKSSPDVNGINLKTGDTTSDSDVRKRRNDAIRTRDVDGGWAFVVFLSSAVTMALLDMFLVQAGIFQLEFLETFGGSRGYLALIGSLFVCSAGILGPVAGALTSKLTPRVTIMTGGVLMFLGMMAASFARSRWELLLTYGIINGLGAGLVYTPSATAFTAYFHKYRQIAIGFVMAAPGVGLLTGPYLARWLLEIHGWRFSMAVYGCLAAQICVMGAAIFPAIGSRNKTTGNCLQLFRRRTKRNSGPDEKSLKSKQFDERSPSQLDESLLEKAKANGNVEFGEKRSSKNSFRAQLVRVLGSRLLWVMSLNQMLLALGCSVDMLHLPSYVVSVGIDFKHYPDMFMVYALTFVCSRILGGFFFNKFSSHLVVWMFGFEVAFALILGFLPLYGTTLPALFVFNFAVGISYSPSYMLLTPVLIQYFGLKDLSIVYGINQLTVGIGFIVGPPVAGMLYDFLGTYTASFYFAGASVGVGALLLLVFLCCPGDSRNGAPAE